MNNKKRFSLPPRYLLFILAIFCFGAMFVTFATKISVSPVKNIVGYIITPMQKGINKVGGWLGDKNFEFKTLEEVQKENDSLLAQIDDLKVENSQLLQERYELDRLRQLYELDEKYSGYEKVAARVIAKDTGNWFSTFTIDKGEKNGIAVDMNVIAGNGLVGIVYDVSAHTAKVRTIINDTSMVSAMFLKTNDSCIVNGSLDTMEDGYLEVVYISKDAKVKNGDELVTSYVSSKFNEGITIGKVSDIKLDSTKLTKTAKVTPIVDFKHLKEVLVITDLKKTENLDTGTKE